MASETHNTKAHGREVVKTVVEQIQNSAIFPDDHGFLRKVAFVESRDGEDPNTFANKNGKPYYGGIWQVDEVGFKDTQDTISHPGLGRKFELIKTNFGIDWTKVKWEDLQKPLHSALAARLRMSNVAEPIPRDVESQASYWKKHYNTSSGKGTEEGFVEKIKGLSAQIYGGSNPGFSASVPVGSATDASLSVRKENSGGFNVGFSFGFKV